MTPAIGDDPYEQPSPQPAPHSLSRPGQRVPVGVVDSGLGAGLPAEFCDWSWIRTWNGRTMSDGRTG